MIDEKTSHLINGLVDNSLSQEDLQQAEKLISEDKQLAELAEFLKRQRSLCLADSSCASPNVADNVKKRLQANKRTSIVRIFKTAAAILIAAVAGTTIWLTGGSEQTQPQQETMIAATEKAQDVSISAIEAPAPMMMAAAIEPKKTNILNYHLSLLSNDTASAKMIIAQFAYEYQMLNNANVSIQDNKTTYTFEANTEQLKKFAVSLSPLWNFVDSAELSLTDFSRQMSAKAANIKHSQFVEITGAGNVDQKLNSVRIASVINKFPSAIDLEIPQRIEDMSMLPVLAGGRQQGEPEKAGYITITIEVISDK